MISKFEVDSTVRSLASWFEPDRVGSATIDPKTGTLLTFTQEVGLGAPSGDPASDFVSKTSNSRDVTNKAFGINVDWQVNDSLKAKFDVSRSTAENDRAGKDRTNVVGIFSIVITLMVQVVYQQSNMMVSKTGHYQILVLHAFIST